jgi:hypothetical protein
VRDRNTEMRDVAKFIKSEGKMPDLLRLAAKDIPLNEAEFHCFCDANNGTAFDPLSFEELGLNVADSGPDGLGEKWGVDLASLARKLNALPALQKCALLAASDGFFGDPCA